MNSHWAAAMSLWACRLLYHCRFGRLLPSHQASFAYRTDRRVISPHTPAVLLRSHQSDTFRTDRCSDFQQYPSVREDQRMPLKDPVDPRALQGIAFSVQESFCLADESAFREQIQPEPTQCQCIAWNVRWTWTAGRSSTPAMVRNATACLGPGFGVRFGTLAV